MFNLDKELAKLKDEYALNMRICQECSQIFITEKEWLKRKINDLTKDTKADLRAKDRNIDQL